jgi:7-keto-8-aminopelargonate synthetase-like enzyme
VLRERVALFDRERPGLAGEGWSPIRMVPAGESERAIRWGEALVDRGYFVTVAFFPVVPRGRAQLRIALTAAHGESEVRGLAAALREVEATVG